MTNINKLKTYVLFSYMFFISFAKSFVLLIVGSESGLEMH